MADLHPIGRVTRLAQQQGREYVTPEDVDDAMEQRGHAPAFEVWRELLQIIGRDSGGWGIEDAGLCAFVAIKDEPRNPLNSPASAQEAP